MNFLTRIETLRTQYSGNLCEQRGCAYLYGSPPKKPPLATHIVFSPMPPKIEQQLLSSYKRSFPMSLLVLYRDMNGCNLFWTSRDMQTKKGVLSIPLCRLSVYAVPLQDSRTSLQPFNIGLEDLNRPEGTPENWLKFGAYYKPNNNSTRSDLYVDVDNDRTFAVKHNSDVLQIEEKWETLDLCLCSIFDLLSQDG